MTAKEEALKLVERFDEYADYPIGCALVAVDEIIKELKDFAFNYDVEGVELFYYWEQVKQEINKL